MQEKMVLKSNSSAISEKIEGLFSLTNNEMYSWCMFSEPDYNHTYRVSYNIDNHDYS